MNQKEIIAHYQAAKAYSYLSTSKIKSCSFIIRNELTVTTIVSVGISDESEHSEKIAIFNAAKNGLSIKDCVLITTGSLCLDCAKAINRSGIAGTYYSNKAEVLALKYIDNKGNWAKKINEKI